MQDTAVYNKCSFTMLEDWYQLYDRLIDDVSS